MAPGVASTLEILVAQGEAQAQVIRDLTFLCRAHGVPEVAIATAKRPLVMEMAAALEQEQGPGHTEPMETDLPLVDEIRASDPIKTVELPTLVAQGLEVES
jgi:hypothetical protein